MHALVRSDEQHEHPKKQFVAAFLPAGPRPPEELRVLGREGNSLAAASEGGALGALRFGPRGLFAPVAEGEVDRAGYI